MSTQQIGEHQELKVITKDIKVESVIKDRMKKVSRTYFSLESDSSPDNKTYSPSKIIHMEKYDPSAFHSNQCDKRVVEEIQIQDSKQKKERRTPSAGLKNKLTRNKSCSIRVISRLFQATPGCVNDSVSTVSIQQVNATQKHAHDVKTAESPVKKMRMYNQKQVLTKGIINLTDDGEGKCICTSSRGIKDNDLETCGRYCKYLSACEQKDIIFRRSIGVGANAMLERHNRVLPAQWWKVWCDFVNIQYKSLKDHFQEGRAFFGAAQKWIEKESASPHRISEVSEVEFDLKTFTQEELKQQIKPWRISTEMSLSRDVSDNPIQDDDYNR